MATVFQPLLSTHHGGTGLLRRMPPSTTVPETTPTLSVTVLHQKPAVEHQKNPKIFWRFSLKKTGATDGAPAVAASSAAPPPVMAAAAATAAVGGAPPATATTTRDNKRKKLSFSFALSKEEVEDDLNIVSALREKKRRKQRPPFSLSLYKEEIEEDLKAIAQFVKPERRVEKKRPAKLQKTMDKVFPGLYLDSITEKSYMID